MNLRAIPIVRNRGHTSANTRRGRGMLSFHRWRQRSGSVRYLESEVGSADFRFSESLRPVRKVAASLIVCVKADGSVSYQGTPSGVPNAAVLWPKAFRP